MKILYLCYSKSDYLESQVLYYLRNKFGKNVVDYPFKPYQYRDMNDNKSLKDKFRMSGLKINNNIKIDRKNIHDRIVNNEFDYIVFGSANRQEDEFLRLPKTKSKLIFIDGSDHGEVRQKMINAGIYFKREYITDDTCHKINFSILSESIVKELPLKTKKFAEHNQTLEAAKLTGTFYKNGQYAFKNENDYFNDLKKSMYAITRKKAGWDCQRHYEISSQGCVMCFYELDKKPKNCAPHNLVDMKNCISFNSSDELKNKIKLIDKNNLYSSLQTNSLNWIKDNTTETTYKYVL
jgi:hypothetical protein